MQDGVWNFRTPFFFVGVGAAFTVLSQAIFAGIQLKI